ncbi:MAG: BrnA antitoxin family protein [Anaerolineae bacterium]|nr:BrnA antitoxin family protein [Anaerolineae bacterium]
MGKKHIPEFKTIRDEAVFWDTHDISDYLDEMEIVSGNYQPRSGETKTVMTIRVAPSLKEQIETIARSYDIPASSLVRMWIVEKIRLLHENAG